MDQYYIQQESTRLSQIMYDNPHAAAKELREELQSIPADAAVALIKQTKVEERNYGSGGLGDLQIQVELDQNGCDSGFRNVIIATPEGPEQIAEFQAGAPVCYDTSAYNGQYYRPDPLAAIGNMIIGNYIWQQEHNLLRNDSYYYGWQHRQQLRENYWQNHQGQWQYWNDQNFRRQIQEQDWQQFAWQPGWYQNQQNVQKYYSQPGQFNDHDADDVVRYKNGLPTPDGIWNGHGHRYQEQNFPNGQQWNGGQTYYPGQMNFPNENARRQEEALLLQKQQEQQRLLKPQPVVPNFPNSGYPNNQGQHYWKPGENQAGLPNLNNQRGDLLQQQKQQEALEEAAKQQLLQQKQHEALEQAERQQQQLLQQKQHEALEQAEKQQQLLQQKQHEALEQAERQQQLLQQRQHEALEQAEKHQPQPVAPEFHQQGVPGNAHQWQGQAFKK